MPKMKFNDGWAPDVTGEYRVITGPDGLYVVGHGVLIPVDTAQEGQETIKELRDADNRGKK